MDGLKGERPGVGRHIRRPLQAEDGVYPDTIGGWKRVERSIVELESTIQCREWGRRERVSNLGLGLWVASVGNKRCEAVEEKDGRTANRVFTVCQASCKVFYVYLILTQPCEVVTHHFLHFTDVSIEGCNEGNGPSLGQAAFQIPVR